METGSADCRRSLLASFNADPSVRAVGRCPDEVAGRSTASERSAGTRITIASVFASPPTRLCAKLGLLWPTADIANRRAISIAMRQSGFRRIERSKIETSLGDTVCEAVEPRKASSLEATAGLQLQRPSSPALSLRLSISRPGRLPRSDLQGCRSHRA